MANQVILCVDDEDLVLKSLRRELNDSLENTYLIETAAGGVDALDVFKELIAEGHEVLLVIADHIMPDMKGDDLLTRIHALSPKTLKIMLTGQANLDAVTNAVNHADLYRYVAKPWEKTDFALTIKEALRRYAQEKQLAEQNRILQNMNVILEQQVKERTAELETANASKDKFFSIIAHDLRSPFTGLLGITQVILEGIDAFSQEEIKESLHSLLNTAKNTYALIENLLTWSRLQRGVMEFFPQEISIATIITYNLALFAANAAQKQITLNNAVAESPLVYVDQNMVNTILRNLLSNALKFTHPGGTISVSATERDAEIEVAVADTGTGIPAEILAQLFRIDVKYIEVGTAGETGTGLGLILCQELVEKNGGQIWVESAEGKGTTFRFTLPKSPF